VRTPRMPCASIKSAFFDRFIHPSEENIEVQNSQIPIRICEAQSPFMFNKRHLPTLNEILLLPKDNILYLILLSDTTRSSTSPIIQNITSTLNFHSTF